MQDNDIDNQDVSSSESEEFSDQSDSHDVSMAVQKKGKSKALETTEAQPNIIVQTAFDAYFTYTSSRVQTSSNVFSSLVPPLTADEFSEAIASSSIASKHIQPSLLSDPSRNLIFSRFLRELVEGFNLLFYGFGSKRRVLNQFATEHCSKTGYVVICNGFQPDFTIKDLLNSVEHIPGVAASELASNTVESQTKRIHEFFAQKSQNRHVYLVIHNIDGPGLRNAKAKSCLALLALNSRIHIVASIDHINAPLLWSTSELSARKNDDAAEGAAPTRGFAWLWHDLTTLASYDFELAFADRTSIFGAHGGGARKKHDGLAAQNATAMSETAALHILASVTQKAKKLFSLLGAKQLESIEEAENPSVNDWQQHGMSYDMLFNAARDNFIATNDTALRSLLGEFRDHGLVMAAQASSGSGEVLWIPLRKERLSAVLLSLQDT